MTTEIIAALIGASVPTFIAIVAYLQWRRDFELKSRQLSEAVTAELIGQRIGPYTELMQELRLGSSHHDTVSGMSAETIERLFDILQSAIYGATGLLATHETRQLMLHARSGCILYKRKAIDYQQLMLRLWALHLSLRSDLGIHQPEWESTVEKVQTATNIDDFTKWEDLVRYYPWERLLVHSADRINGAPAK